MTPTPEISPKSLAERVRACLNNGQCQIKPLPAVAVKLLELLRDEDRAEPNNIAPLVRGEPAIAAGVLRLANSATFVGLPAVTDLGMGIARLGLRQVGGLVTTLAHQDQFAVRRPEHDAVLRRLWSHAVLSAFAASRLCQAVPALRSDAYVAALLHDVGKLIVLRAVEHLQELEPAPEITLPLLEDLMESLHLELGPEVLLKWRIPKNVCEAVRRHHEDATAETPPLLLRVQAADVIATRILSEESASAALPTHPVLDLLQLSDLELATVLVDVEDDQRRLNESLGLPGDPERRAA